MKDKKRSIDCIKHGVIDKFIVTLIITILFEIIAKPLIQLFALSVESTVKFIDVYEKATRIASTGYIFIGFIVAIQ